MVDTNLAENNNKHKFVTDKYKVPCVYLYEQKFEWIEYQPKQKFLVLNSVYPDGVFIPKVLEGINIIIMET